MSIRMLSRLSRLVLTPFLLVTLTRFSSGERVIFSSAVECDVKDVKISVRSLQRYSDRWEIEVEIQNNSQSPVFFATEPRRSNGELGPYVGVDDAGKTLEVSARFFDRPNAFISVDVRGVKLKKLESNASYVERYVLSLPLRETTPPFLFRERKADTPKPIDANKIETVKIYVSIVPDDEGIRDLLVPKASKPYFDGYFGGGEKIEKGCFKGKPLLEIQSILSATYEIGGKN